ncbi:MAG: hypothetical protein AAF431_10885 [Pseudomonadota bacterium]
MSEPVIELIQLENGDIALRHSDAPDEPLLTITFSDQVRNFLQSDQMVVAHAMVEAGMNSYRDVQIERIKQVKEASANGLLH